ncbi:HEPN domain-containing protein [Kutzneria sp. NPDC052558]|uniref:ApeA N-terminal domain 1-containing protein n=1 Tax=Kutzneria sp. NPDC052558 TaxID=3364121 RepID=UPI0037CC4447
MDPFETQGSWWVPGKKRHHHATGKFKYSPDEGGTLNVFGKRLEASDSLHVPALFGDTERGPATLFGCNFKGAAGRPESRHFSQDFTVDLIVLGCHTDIDFAVNHASVQVENLDRWASIGKLDLLGEDVRKLLPNAGFGVYFQHEPDMWATLGNGDKVLLSALDSFFFGRNNATVAVKYQFDITFAQAKRISEIREDYIVPLIDLLTVFTDTPSSLQSLTVSPPAGKRSALHGPRFQPLDIGFQINRNESSRQIASESLYPVKFSEFSFRQQLPLWFELAQKLKGVHGLTFGLRYADNMSAENRYLNSTTAAEALHRATFESVRAKIDLKNDATRTWISQFPAEEQALIKTRLNQYINDPSLGDRLHGLIKKAGVAFDTLVPDPTEWVKLVKQVRNDLTHQEGTPKVRVTSEEMYWLAESIAQLVTICILVDLGYAPTAIDTQIVRSHRVQALIRQMARQFSKSAPTESG